jgi:hypothetical protein
MPLWVDFCRAISGKARLLYPTKLPRRPFAIAAARLGKSSELFRYLKTTFETKKRARPREEIFRKVV